MVRWQKKKTTITVVILATLLSSGIAIALLKRQSAVVDPFTAKTIASVKFPIYYPTQLPKGFRIDPKSVTQPEDDVLIFNLIDGKGRKIYISQQARSTTYNYGRFFKDINGHEFKTSLGQAKVGELDGQTTIGSVVSDKTWIISNSKSNTATPADVKKVLQHLSFSH